jgi:DNA-binding SARP family transcriptional activator
MTPEQLQDHPVVESTDGIVLRVLGRFSLIVDGVPQDLPVQVQKVIAFLALHDGSQPRDRVAERVWPDADLKHCRGSLRTVLWRVRQVSPDAVHAPRGSISLGPSVQVDLHEGLAVAKRILDGRPVDPDRAIPLLSRRLLPDWDDEWSLLEQERVQQMHVHCLEILSRRLMAERQYAYAMQAAGAACRIEPLRESAQRTVIDILRAEGNHVQARRVFEDFRRMLRAELGIEPSAQLAPFPGVRVRALEPVASHPEPNPQLSGSRVRTLRPGLSAGYLPASPWTGRQPSAV